MGCQSGGAWGRRWWWGGSAASAAAAAVLPFDCLGDERRLRQHCHSCLCAWCLVHAEVEGGWEGGCVCGGGLMGGGNARMD